VRQTWAAPKSKLTSRFDIRERQGYWENGVSWVAQLGRCAQIYIFAYHPVADETADHRDPLQWQFHVVPARKLPSAQTIGLTAVKATSPALCWTGLFQAVEQERLSL
jgi:hypothetical protein